MALLLPCDDHLPTMSHLPPFVDCNVHACPLFHQESLYERYYAEPVTFSRDRFLMLEQVDVHWAQIAAQAKEKGDQKQLEEALVSRTVRFTYSCPDEPVSLVARRMRDIRFPTRRDTSLDLSECAAISTSTRFLTRTKSWGDCEQIGTLPPQLSPVSGSCPTSSGTFVSLGRVQAAF